MACRDCEKRLGQIHQLPANAPPRSDDPAYSARWRERPGLIRAGPPTDTRIGPGHDHRQGYSADVMQNSGGVSELAVQQSNLALRFGDEGAGDA